MSETESSAYNIETNSLGINELIDTIKKLSLSSTNEDQLRILGDTLIKKINNIPCELRDNPEFDAIKNKLEDYQQELEELQKGGYRKKKTRYNKKTNTQKKQKYKTKKYNMRGGFDEIASVYLTIGIVSAAIASLVFCINQRIIQPRNNTYGTAPGLFRNPSSGVATGATNIIPIQQPVTLTYNIAVNINTRGNKISKKLSILYDAFMTYRVEMQPTSTVRVTYGDPMEAIDPINIMQLIKSKELCENTNEQSELNYDFVAKSFANNDITIIFYHTTQANTIIPGFANIKYDHGGDFFYIDLVCGSTTISGVVKYILGVLTHVMSIMKARHEGPISDDIALTAINPHKEVIYKNYGFTPQGPPSKDNMQFMTGNYQAIIAIISQKGAYKQAVMLPPTGAAVIAVGGGGGGGGGGVAVVGGSRSRRKQISVLKQYTKSNRVIRRSVKHRR